MRLRVCLAKSGSKKWKRKEETGRLYPARLGREQTELSGATRDEGWKNWFSPARRWGSPLPSACAAGGTPGRHGPPCRMECVRDANEGRDTEDYEEQEEDFSSTWAAGGTLTWICWINTWASPGQVSCHLLVGGSFIFFWDIFMYAASLVDWRERKIRFLQIEACWRLRLVCLANSGG